MHAAGLLGGVTLVAFVVHVAGGTIALVAGLVAVFALKGGWLHRTAGKVFTVAMLAMATFAIYLAVVRPGQQPNVIIGLMAAYLVATAWLTVQPQRHRLAELAAFGVILLLCVPFVLLSAATAFHLPLPFKTAFSLSGPIAIAIWAFTLVTLIAAGSDVRVLFFGGIAGVARIARHLWRMCFGLTLAAGSAFTNGLPRLLPKSAEPPDWALFVPQLLVLCLLIFWMIRVRGFGLSRRWDVASTGDRLRGVRARQVA